MSGAIIRSFGYFSTLNEQLYLNLMTNIDYDFKQPHELTSASLKDHTYCLLHVKVLGDDRVQITPMTPKAAVALIEAGVLSGTIIHHKDSFDSKSVKLTSSTAALASAVANPKNGGLFDPEFVTWHYHRLK